MSPHTFPSDRAISFRERAEALGDLVRAEAADAERQGRLTDKIVAALQQERLLAVLFPESAGGLGGSRGDLFEITEVMARADGSTGWCVALSNVPTFAVFRGLSAEGREDVFGRGHVSCWAALIPNASSTAVSGGFRISGKWAYGSTSSFARWVLVTSVSKDAEGRNLYRAHLVPKEDVEIIEGTWDVLGLRATASIDYAITDKFVPAHRTYEFGSEGTAANGPISAMETVWLNQVGLAAFASGVAQRALSEFTASAAKTKRIAGIGSLAEDNIIQLGVAEFEGRLQAARAHYRELISRQDELAAREEAVGPALRAQITLAFQTLARAARETALFVYEHSASSIVYASSPTQRCFRDLLTGLKHAAFTPAILARVGRVRLGLPPLPPVL